MVGRLYAAGLEVDEPFTRFTWHLSPDEAYACLYAEADDADCLTGGPLHKQRRCRIAGQLSNALERWQLSSDN